MKNIIPKDSRYVPFTQQPWCCAPTCILMIMYKHNIPLVSQELLGYHLGLIVPEKESGYFFNVRTGKRPPAGYGTRIYFKRYSPNIVFKKLKIPLKFKFYKIRKFKKNSEIISFLEKAEKEDRNIMLCFNYKNLYGEGNDGGHLSIFDIVNKEKGTIRLVDPSRKSPKWREVKIIKIINAMKLHYKNSGGIWELEKIKEK